MLYIKDIRNKFTSKSLTIYNSHAGAYCLLHTVLRKYLNQAVLLFVQIYLACQTYSYYCNCFTVNIAAFMTYWYKFLRHH